MFNVGDYIVHPMHGAGVVEALEKRGEENVIYFVLRLFSGNLKVLVPSDKAEQIGVRRVIPEDEIASVLKVLQRDDQEKIIPNWNHRYRANLEKIQILKFTFPFTDTGQGFQEETNSLSTRDTLTAGFFC
jgi:CarD family transcriptional regulator